MKKTKEEELTNYMNNMFKTGEMPNNVIFISKDCGFGIKANKFENVVAMLIAAAEDHEAFGDALVLAAMHVANESFAKYAKSTKGMKPNVDTDKYIN